MYVTYITMYTGNKLPKWYIGSSSLSKVTKGYRGSVKSIAYKDKWKDELATNPHLFKTRILQKFGTREEALAEELRLHVKHDVASNDSYINMSLACVNGFFGRNVTGCNNPRYDTTISKEQKSKYTTSMNTPNNEGITPREIATKKMKATKSTKAFKEKQQKQVNTLLDDIVDGKNFYQRISEKGIKSRSSQEWQEANRDSWIASMKNTRNTLQPSGKTFQQEVVEKAAKTRVAKSQHYDVIDARGCILHKSVPKSFVRNTYGKNMLSTTKEKPYAWSAYGKTIAKQQDKEFLIGTYVELVKTFANNSE